MSELPSSEMKPFERSEAYPHQGRGDHSSADDAALIARMRSGDEQALGLFFDRWQDVVRATALRIVGEPMEAEDVVEDVFWQVWRQADRFDVGRGGVATWLLTMTRSRALDRLRAIRRSRESTPLDDLEHHGDAAIDLNSDPQADVELGERSRRIRAALLTLPDEQRESLELAYFEGLSQSEIAQRTSQPLGTVKTRMRLAMQKLREQVPDLRETVT
jgi:RNA polymerase sigma-70 factor, ECF subfamily